MSVAKVTKMLKDNEVKYVDLRFTDTIGKEQHVTMPVSQSVQGWQNVRRFQHCRLEGH